MPKVNEKKQVFNTYKQQKANEEKEQERERAKENREKLQTYLEEHPRMHSHIRYRKASEIFESDKMWNAVAESCLLYTSPSPRDATLSRMPSSA